LRRVHVQLGQAVGAGLHEIEILNVRTDCDAIGLDAVADNGDVPFKVRDAHDFSLTERRSAEKQKPGRNTAGSPAHA